MTVMRGALLGSLAAALPVVAAAQEAEGRALPAPADFGGVVLVTALAVGALLLVTAVGYLYRRERRLDWEFQKPDASTQGTEGHH
ncbi:MAG: hypothetical protein FJZ92_01425 [Chloroflexi bacterium]|nr:hypothetical protein [Chloroflexota bacterium]